MDKYAGANWSISDGDGHIVGFSRGTKLDALGYATELREDFPDAYVVDFEPSSDVLRYHEFHPLSDPEDATR